MWARLGREDSLADPSCARCDDHANQDVDGPMLPRCNNAEGTECEYRNEPVEVLVIFLREEIANKHRAYDVTTGKNANGAIHGNHFAVDGPTIPREFWSGHFRGKENPNRSDRPVGDDERNDIANETLLLPDKEDSQSRSPEKSEIRKSEDG